MTLTVTLVTAARVSLGAGCAFEAEDRVWGGGAVALVETRVDGSTEVHLFSAEIPAHRGRACAQCQVIIRVL